MSTESRRRDDELLMVNNSLSVDNTLQENEDSGAESDDTLLAATDEVSSNEGLRTVLAIFQSRIASSYDRLLTAFQSRSPRRRNSRRRRRCLKKKEQNYGASLCSVIAAVCLCCALVDSSWFTLRGGGCKDIHGRHINSLGVFTFLYPGRFEHYVSSVKHEPAEVRYSYQKGSHTVSGE